MTNECKQTQVHHSQYVHFQALYCRSDLNVGDVDIKPNIYLITQKLVFWGEKSLK